MDWNSLVPVAAVVVGYLLSELSRRRETRSALLRRWDDDRRAVYAEYLGAIDELYDVTRGLERIEEWLEDPEGRVTKMRTELTPEQFKKAVQILKDKNLKERRELWEQRKAIQQRIGRLQGEIDILATMMTQVRTLFVGPSLDPKNYHSNRRELIDEIRKELKVPDFDRRTGPSAWVRRNWKKLKQKRAS